MKIAMLYAFWEGEPWSFPLSLRREFVDRGHDVCDFNLYAHNGVTSYKGEIRKYSNEGLNNLFSLMRNNQYKPDMLLHMDYGVYDCPYMDKANFPGIITICELGDTPQSLARSWTKSLKFDITITPDYDSTMILKSKGVNAHHWPHCADSNIFKPYEDEKILYDCVTTCGPRGNGLTDQVKSALGNAFFNERYFWGEAYGRVLNRGKMIFQCSQFKEVTRRIFEGVCSKRMVITDRLPQHTHITDIFEDGKDIVYYNDANDCINKIKYFAANDNEREVIALNGYNKAMANHTVKRRVDQIFEYMDMLPK